MEQSTLHGFLIAFYVEKNNRFKNLLKIEAPPIGEAHAEKTEYPAAVY